MHDPGIGDRFLRGRVLALLGHQELRHPVVQGPDIAHNGHTGDSDRRAPPTPSIDTTLVAGGEIKGTVTAASGGVPLSTVCVEAVYPGTESDVASTTTASTGTYLLKGLATGSYAVEFSGCYFSAENYAPQWWDNKTTLSVATLVTVTAGGPPTPNINASHGGRRRNQGHGDRCVGRCTARDNLRLGCPHHGGRVRRLRRHPEHRHLHGAGSADGLLQRRVLLL